MIMDLFLGWSTPTWISLGGFCISIITAIFLIINFFQNRNLAKTSLAINQFNIYYNSLKDFIDEAKKIQFKPEYEDEEVHPIVKQHMEKSNGIWYIQLLMFVSHMSHLDIKPDEKLKSQMFNFTYCVLAPLVRYYDKLLHFLNAVYDDTVLADRYKKIIFNKVEQELLQIYFRVCNNVRWQEKKEYDLSKFKTVGFDTSIFYEINSFYIKNKLFQYKNLEFYIKTL